jgi:DNA polymerase-3 subunit epsilon
MRGLDRYLSDLLFANSAFVVLDFEGTTPAKHPAEPIEVGAVVLRPSADAMTCVCRYEALIQPPTPAPLTAADPRQTGVTAVMLADRAAAGPVLAGLDALLTQPPYVTVAHHAPTQAGILRRCAHACPTLAAAPMLDTLLLAKACHPGLASYSLDALLTHYLISIPAARHRAFADVEVTSLLFMRLLADGANRHGWSQLVQLRNLAGRLAPTAGSAQAELV